MFGFFGKGNGMNRKRIAFLMIAVLTVVSFGGCGSSSKKKNTRDDYALCEHIVSIGALLQEDNGERILPDADGYYAVRENVYVNTDTLNIREKDNAESKLIAVAEYGKLLSRTGIGQNGWDRVEFDGMTCYVGSDLITTVPISTGSSFDFSTAVLTIVDTKRKQYSYDDMCADLKELEENFGDRMKLNCIGTSFDNRNIFEVVIGTDNAKKDLYFVAGLCGAEYMSCNVMMKQIEYYLHYYDAGYYNGYCYADLFDNVRIHVVPMLNPDSVEISQQYLAGMRLEKTVLNLKDWFDRDQMSGKLAMNLDTYLMQFFANARGVDLRKNFPYQWELTGTKLEPGDSGYRGESAGSEAEVKALEHSLSEVNPNLVVAYHTTGSRIYCNYGQNDELFHEAREYGSALSKLMTYELNDTKITEEGYGTLAGYCNNVISVPALTVNLGNGSAPLSPNEFNAIWNACRDSWAAMQINLITW